MTRDSMELLEVEDPAVEVMTQYLNWKEIDTRDIGAEATSYKLQFLLKSN